MENFFTRSLKNISQSESNSNMKYKYKLVMNCTEIVKILYPQKMPFFKKRHWDSWVKFTHEHFEKHSLMKQNEN